jgi:hypothetical protein
MSLEMYGGLDLDASLIEINSTRRPSAFDRRRSRLPVDVKSRAGRGRHCRIFRGHARATSGRNFLAAAMANEGGR